VKLLASVDRCRAPRRSIRLIGLSEPTAYDDRPMHAGLQARLGRLRLRLYLLGAQR
jgi:hypothetical protein